MSSEINSFIEVSNNIGRKPDLIQGSGGNTSIKFNSNKMMIKASGYQLKDMDTSEACTVVNHKDIENFFLENAFKNTDLDIMETISSDFINNKVVEEEEYPKLRPSMETGFHAVLGKVVIHTHSVYSNLINCSIEGKKMMNNIINKMDNITPAYIPFCNPGYELSQKILLVKLQHEKKYGEAPNVYFLENHGLVTTEETVSEAYALHNKVDTQIKNYFNLNNYKYPNPNIERVNNKKFKSNCSELIEVMLKVVEDESYFERILFPDQVVFFTDNISLNKKNKIVINPKSRSITYNTNQKEALVIEETFLAYLFIQQTLKSKDIGIRYIGEDYASYINNMESESYRRSLLK